MIVVALVVIGVLIFVVNPMFLGEVDPNASGPQITRTGSTDGQEPELRNSITDLLVKPNESNPEPEHPLDPALKVARLGLEKIRAEVQDYTALMVKQEQVKGKLLPEEYMRVKVRHASADGKRAKAFYVRHVKPQGVAGQEAIWVEGRNDGKLTAHGAGLQKLLTVNLDPESWVAMRNNRYPITELGIETLILRMIEKGERDRQHQDDCTVEISRDIELDGNPCTLITITHPEEKDPFEFYKAKIYIDDKLQLPVGYEGFLWPETPGGEPVLVERYFYREMNVNVGLEDADFDPDNPNYDYR